MDPYRSIPRTHTRRGAIVTLVAAILLAASLTVAHGAGGIRAAAPSTGCQLLSAKDQIQHVIYVQFDNTHFLRDNPNVPSDLEQMPHLLSFIKDNGTLLTNDHTVLISHTAGGILSSLTGLYPDRNGQAVSNSYGYFRPDGSVGFSSSFKYWTDAVDGGNPVPPPTPSGDTTPNMVNADPVSLGGTGAVRNAPAPWVPDGERRARKQQREHLQGRADDARGPLDRRGDEHQGRQRRGLRRRPDDHDRHRGERRDRGDHRRRGRNGWPGRYRHHADRLARERPCQRGVGLRAERHRPNGRHDEGLR
jgi:hypothetical protein